MTSLNLPASTSVVRVRAIDAITDMVVSAKGFVEPVLDGHENLNLTSVTFLVENERLGKKVLFDCGARKDFENFSPRIKARLNLNVRGLKIEKDVNDVVQEAGIPLESLDSMIWSHWHWDHHGAPEKYPTSVEIVVGEGFKSEFMPGYPTNPDAIFLDANFENRNVREISFGSSTLRIGPFPAYDFFSDGSFYLLDTPGHAIGHMCGLARTTPTTFILMGGDICHFGGSFRPSSSFPLPDPVPDKHLDHGSFASPCPCDVFLDAHPAASGARLGTGTVGRDVARTVPFYEVTSAAQSAYLDREVAMKSIAGLQVFDACEDVLVCIAHDPTLLKVLPVLNREPERDLNAWKEKGWKEETMWGWLNELPRGGKPGRPALVEGVWRKGKLVEDFTKL